MRIQSSQVALSAHSKLSQSHTKSETSRFWVGNQPPASLQQPSQNVKEVLRLKISAEAKEMLAKSRENASAAPSDEVKAEIELSEPEKQKIKMIEDFIQALTGKKIKIQIPKKVELKDTNTIVLHLDDRQAQIQPRSVGWGFQYDFHEEIVESESLSFQAQGNVKTADGRNIDFSVQLNMNRSFAMTNDIHIRAGDAARVDPLVINFSSAGTGLTTTKFEFDIDNNGTADQISFVNPGSGFLAIDSNGDGIINNGSELFGPRTGDGFAELAGFDSDKNGWIDENDPVFNQLRIWSTDESGNKTLFALGAVGVGAIYLGNVDSKFSIKDTLNNEQGQITQTGIFLRENGTAGTIQHVDLTL